MYKKIKGNELLLQFHQRRISSESFMERESLTGVVNEAFQSVEAVGEAFDPREVGVNNNAKALWF